MAQAPDNEERRNIGPIEAYQIFAEGERENNRLLTERTTIYLTASSILFLALVMLNQSTTLAPTLVKWFRIILSISGIFLTLLVYSFNRATHNALDFLAGAMKQIEDGPEFTYMRENGFLPHTDGWKFVYGEKQWDKSGHQAIPGGYRRNPIPMLFRNASCVCLTLTFGLLWVTSLILAILSFN
jgi:hypothetical protein